MNKAIKPFNHDSVDPKTAQYLEIQDYSINEVLMKADYEIGKILYEVQQQLAKDRYQCFEEWCESLPIDKSSQQYINIYKFFGSEFKESKDRILSLLEEK